jgi:hypothetical protein
MRRSVLVLVVLASSLAACGPAVEVPTPLPTAVPPDPGADGSIWSLGFRYDFPAGVFGPGRHRYAFLIHCPVVYQEDLPSDWIQFEISQDVVPQPDPIYLRLGGLSSDLYNPTYNTNTAIHPDRPVVAVVYLVGLDRPVAELAAKECEVIVFWDSHGRHSLGAQEPFLP